jgi:hypothetical protein
VARLGRLRPAPVALTLAMVDLWKRLTPQQRKQVVEMVRRHGPTVVSRAARMTRRRTR